MRTNLLEFVARGIHAARGARSLAVSGILVLILTSLENALPPNLIPWLSGATLMTLAIGLSTIAREGATAQANLPTALKSPDTVQRMAKLLIIPVLLLILLLPRIFLGAYGIPHMTPLTGLILPAIQRQLGLMFLAVILFLPLIALRQARKSLSAPSTRRPRDIPSDNPIHDRRDLLIICAAILTIVWLYLMHTFWAPFTLLAWPPGFASLSSVRGVTALAFTLGPPIVLFMRIALHAELAQLILLEKDQAQRTRWMVLNAAHLIILLACVALHAYDLLWIAEYQTGSNL